MQLSQDASLFSLKQQKSAIIHRLLADVDVTSFGSRSPPDRVTESNLSN